MVGVPGFAAMFDSTGVIPSSQSSDPQQAPSPALNACLLRQFGILSPRGEDIFAPALELPSPLGEKVTEGRMRGLIMSQNV